MKSSPESLPHVVVLGAGFGGLAFCRAFSGKARITLVDRQNHHLFQPLLYQVATASLSGPDIAQPIRAILRKKNALTVRMAEVKAVDLDARRVVLDQGELSYDYLVLALGGQTNYFGHDDWARHAPGLKTLDDAMRIRREVLLAYERAEAEPDEAKRRVLLTTVVVGGGPTGVELAGTFAELARKTLPRDFDHVDPSRARVILVEALPRLLGMFPEKLADEARRRLERLGVEVRTGAPVREIRAGEVVLEREAIAAANIFWVAGVGAPALTRSLGAETDKAGRLKVRPDLSLPGRPEVFAIGDLAALSDAEGRPVPGVAPAAIQMGRHLSRLIGAELAAGGPGRLERRPFRYRDKGSMATIGRGAAIARIGAWQSAGMLAWLAWLGVHLVSLIGFRNKLMVLIHWFYCYVARRPGTRIILGMSPAEPADEKRGQAAADLPPRRR